MIVKQLNGNERQKKKLQDLGIVPKVNVEILSVLGNYRIIKVKDTKIGLDLELFSLISF